MKLNRNIALIVLAISCLRCDPTVIQRVDLQITSPMDGMPAESADISLKAVPSTQSPSDTDESGSELLGAPRTASTDADGLVSFSFIRYACERPLQDKQLQVEIGTGVDAESITISATTGAISTGDNFRVEVLDVMTDADCGYLPGP